MFKATVDAGTASRLFNLSEYQVVDVTRDGLGRRTVVIATRVREAACPACGVATSRVHQRTVQRVRDVPFDGQVTVVWVKRRWRCAESACGRVTFTEHTDQVPVRARMTTRLKDAVVVAVATEARAVSGVAAAFGVSWASVHRQVRVAGARLAAAWAARPRLVRWLGIDEHRFRSVRWFREEAGAWRRLEPWSTDETVPRSRGG